MRVLIITRQYFPHGDATSNVIHNLAKEFLYRGWDVQILALTSYKDDTDVHMWEGVSLENIYLPCSIDRAQIKKEWKKHFMGTAFAIGQKIYSLLKTRIEKDCWELNINPVFRDAFENKIIEYQNKGYYDLCIATIMPIEAVSAAMNVCDKETVFAVYQLDTYWNNDWLPEKYQAKRKQYEERLINHTDFVIATPLIKQISDMAFSDKKGKIIGAEFPMITEKETTGAEKKYNDTKTHCVFLGRLYKGVRPPELVIKVIQRAKDKNVVYDFYGTGQHLISAVLEKEDQTEKTVKLHGTVSSTEARKIQDAAHFLINIDNTTTLQVPSKIFEYMCTGKPIINFYFIENSPTLHYLEKYPNCVNIFLNGNMDTEAKRLDHFITMNKDIMVPYSEIKEAFKKNTPEYVADLFYTEYSEAKRRRS